MIGSSVMAWPTEGVTPPRRPAGAVLRQMPRILPLLLILPVCAGLAGTIAPAFALAAPDGPNLSAFRALFDQPGTLTSIKLSLTTGLAATVLALALAVLIPAALSGTAAFRRIQVLLSPLLALPHAAAALGLAFLIAPSGWIARAISPWATGWTIPPDLLILNDPAGIALTFGLIAKELPFLLLMTIAALPQTDAAQRLNLAATLGYGRIAGFLFTVGPPLYRQLRLPSFAVLTYAMTTVDMAVILGPTSPSTLAVSITRWMTDPSLSRQNLAAAAALVQLATVVAALILWRIGEAVAASVLTSAAFLGLRLTRLDAITPMIHLITTILTLALIAGIAALALWSFAGLWPFPAARPQTLTLATWQSAASALIQTSTATLTIATMATAIALALTLAALQAEHEFALPPANPVLIYLPLLLPQICLLPGIAVLMLRLGITGSPSAVIAAHVLFVLPYVHLSLAAPFRAWDRRIATTAAALGASPARIFWHLRLPMLTAPVLTAAAIGLAVSVAQYLPTLLIGGGRVITLTTEALALSSGGNRRLTAAYALLQTLIPLLAFAAALLAPRFLFRNRRLMQVH